MYRFILLTLLLSTLHSTACADGFFVWRNEDLDIHEPQQKALISFHEGVEELVIEVKFEGAVEDFAWLVPLPAVPEVRAVDKYLFEALSKATQDPQVGYGLHQMTASLGISDGLGDVDVISRQKVGVYDLAVLAGGSEGRLASWLEREGFRIPDHGTGIVDEYLERDWVFAAMRIDPSEMGVDTVAASLADGTIEPILFRFPAVEPVYPLRISSIMGQASEILLYVLADEALVPEPMPNTTWETGIYGKVHWWPFWEPPEYRRRSDRQAMRDSTYYFEALSTEWQAFDRRAALTKLRAVIEPPDMVDLTFRDYDAVSDLKAESLADRVQAISYLGYRRDARGVGPLCELLWNASEPVVTGQEAYTLQRKEGISPGQDARSALWALGNIGDPAVVPEVRRWAYAKDSWSIAEAFMALKALDRDACRDLAVELLGRIEVPENHGYILKNVAEACRDLLVAYGDHGNLPGLDKVIRDRYESSSWLGRKNRDHNPGVYALVASAACGSDWSVRELKRVLRGYAEGWGGRRSRGSVNGYPGSVLGARMIALDSGRSGNDPLSVVTFDLAGRPGIRDDILRDVVHGTDQGAVRDELKAVILARLSEMTPADAEALIAIWRRSLTPPPEGTTKRHSKSMQFDVRPKYADAMAAAYAMGRQFRFESLCACWSEVPWSDPDLKGDLCVAFTMTDNERAAPMILEYMRKTWRVDPHDGEFEVRTTGRGHEFWSWSQDAFPDCRYRVGPILRFLESHARSDLLALAVDSELPPSVRAFLLIKVFPWSRTEDKVALLKELLPELGDTPLSACIRFEIDRLETILARQPS
ncbi:DUF2330 domain-containing protein [bacterium]|nr:DUF2330 domain-containing protein [bacterium]